MGGRAAPTAELIDGSAEPSLRAVRWRGHRVEPWPVGRTDHPGRSDTRRATRHYVLREPKRRNERQMSMRWISVLIVLGATAFGCGSESVSGADPSTDAEAVFDERCETPKEPYGPGAEVIASFDSAGDFEVVCWIDGSVAKAPPGGDPFDRAVVGVGAEGTATLIQAGYRDSLTPEAP